MTLPVLPLILVCVLGSGTVAAGQIQVRIETPLAGQGGLLGQEDPDEVGVPVDMFENPNLDRYLRKAQDFLGRQDYAGAIEVLQDVVEGRTVEAVDSTGEPVEGQEDNRPPREASVDASQAVFSENGRLFRPVRRLCQELLATMPSEGLDLYRTTHEVSAARLLDEARAGTDLHLYEQVYNRYFVTLAAGRAMLTAGDLLMAQGRFRGAIQVFQDLLELYPEDGRRQIGLNEVYIRFKLALCLRMLGEKAAAKEAARLLAEEYPDESLRIMGELSPVRDLPGSDLFETDATLTHVQPVSADPGLRVLATAEEELVPLWEFRFHEPAPYRTPLRSSRSNRGGFAIQGGQPSHAAPYATRYGTGTSVWFFGGGVVPSHALFMDHFRIRKHDALTGLMLKEGDGALLPGRPRDNMPRSRVPVYDLAAMQVVADADHFYAVLGYEGSSTSNLSPILDNRLVAYDRASLSTLWSTDDWQDGEDGMRDVTVLTAPTLFGERLLVPVLRRGTYSLQCLDRNTGKPLWRTPVHSGGTDLVRAPGTPVEVSGGIALMLTNAGGLAAVDAFTGDLRWVRKYERRHPLRKHGRSSRRSSGRPQNYGLVFEEVALDGFMPSRLHLVDGLVVFAPSDGDVLMCLDTATGDPVWMIEGLGRYAPYQKLEYIVGANSRHLYVAAEGDLVCIGLRSGVRLWHRSLPQDEAIGKYRGRGLVAEDLVVLPGARELLAISADGQGGFRYLPLPAFSMGQEPLGGAGNLFRAGPFLGVAYEGGIEVYSSLSVLRQLAAGSQDPLEKAGYLAQAGDLGSAIDVLETFLSGAGDDGRRETAVERMMGLARELALARGAHGEKEAALGLLARVEPHLVDREQRMHWRLARLDLFQLLQDLDSYEREQQRLYELMEGKG